MVVIMTDKNAPISFGHEMKFKKLLSVNKSNYNVKMDVYVTDGDVLCVEIISVDDEYRG